MKKPIGIILSAFLTIALTLAACGGTSASPKAEPSAAPESTDQAQTEYESGGLRLRVPEEYAGLVTVTTGEDPLFSVSEIASQEAAKSRDPDNWEGAGWLFSVSRITEDELHRMLCRDMSGQRIIARDSSGSFYLAETPTDVRLERSGALTPEDTAQWATLTEWSGQAINAFAAENGLTACSYGNSELDMLLARIAWDGDTEYSITGLTHGTVFDRDRISSSFAEQLLTASGGFIYTERTETPEGEYLTLSFPGDGMYFRFFFGEGGQYVLAHRGSDEWFRSANGTDTAQIISQWYEALSSRSAADVLQAAAEKVLAEYAALTMDVLENYDETAHPELPWYTAVIANPMRNNLYYGWYDFDGNGTPELVIAAGDEDYRQPMAIYSFDGEKMVYLCKDHPLGERSALTYFSDGMFAVHGSGGAAVGSITLWRIAADGIGTEIIDNVNYEYRDENTVIYTPELGNVSAEGFNMADYMTGFSVPIEYTLFAKRAASD